MKLIWYEVRKLCMYRITLAILALLLCANAGLVLRSAYEPISKTYNYNQITISRFFSDHADMSADEIEEEIEEWQLAYNNLVWFDDDGNVHWPTQEQREALLTYTDSTDAEAEFYALILEKVRAVSDYDAYLDYIDEEAARMKHSNLFTQPDTFTYRNIEKTQLAYLPMRTNVLTLADSSGVKLAMEPYVTTVCLLFSAMLLVLALMISEREQGFFALIKPMKNGILPTVLAKIGALALMLLMLTLLFYGENLLIGNGLFGLGDLGRSIQSLDGYSTSNLRLTVGQYILLFLGAKYLSVLAVGLLFFCICLFARNTLTSCLIACGILLGELALYWSIPLHSWLSPLRQINFVSLLDTMRYFDDYRNMNLFGFPVNTIVVGCLTGVVLIALSVVLSLLRWQREETVRALRSRPGKPKRVRVSTSLLGHELFKLFITQRGTLILLLFMALQLYTYSGVRIYTNQDEFYYQQYAQVLSGELTGEKRAYLDEQQSFFDSISTQIDEIYAKAAEGEISESYADYQARVLSQELNRMGGFLRAADQYAYLEAQAEKGYSVAFVMDTGYSALLVHAKEDVLDAGKLCFVLVVGLAAFFPMEEQSHMIALIRPSVRGKRSVTRRKLVVTGLYTFLSAVIAMLPRMLVLMHRYDLPNWSAGARSLSEFCYAPNGLSIAVWFAVVLLLRLLAVGVAAGLTLLVSAKSKNTIATLLIMLILLELPVCLYLLGVNSEWGLLSFITGHIYSVG